MDLFTIKSDTVERIERLTSETLLREDIDDFERLCDHINMSEDGPKEALKGIKKRLKHRNPKVVLFSLKLLEVCVNHCGEPFHSKLVSRDFLPDFVKILKTPNQNEDVVEKMLDLIQIWAVGLAYDSINAPLLQVQSELLDDGMDFPYRDRESFGSISRTPKRSPQPLAPQQTSPSLFDPRGSPGVVLAPPPPNQHRGPPPQFYVQGNAYPGQVLQPPSRHPQQPSLPSPQKMRDDLSSMKACAELFAETLTYIDPKTENVARNDLIQECHGHCRHWQKVLNEYLQLCEDESLLVDLLAINDELNSQFEHYADCAAKYLEGNPLAELGPTLPPRPTNNPSPSQHAPNPAPGQFSYTMPSHPAPAEASLISFDEDIVTPPTNPMLDPSLFHSSTLPSTTISPSSAAPVSSPYPSSSSSPYPRSAAPPSASPSSEAPPQGDERLQIKEILGVDPDEFSEDQLTQDLASLGFTKEQLLEMRGQDANKDSDQGSVNSFDEEHRLMDSRMKR